MNPTGGQGAVFLDKDGTLLSDLPFNVDPGKMRFAQGAREALEAFATTDIPLFVVSNQAGIAKGLFEEAALEGVEQRLGQMFEECGARMAAFYYCPHHPDGSVPAYACACCCRKPEPGMLFQAMTEHGTVSAKSWMVGDILDDIEAGRRAGCKTILVDNGNETEWDLSPRRVPDHRVPTLDEAARVILRAASQAS